MDGGAVECDRDTRVATGGERRSGVPCGQKLLAGEVQRGAGKSLRGEEVFLRARDQFGRTNLLDERPLDEIGVAGSERVEAFDDGQHRDVGGVGQDGGLGARRRPRACPTFGVSSWVSSGHAVLDRRYGETSQEELGAELFSRLELLALRLDRAGL